MDVLWDSGGPMLIRELLVELNGQDGRALAYTTVQTVAERLLKKGLLSRRPYRNAFKYTAARTRAEHLAELMLEALAADDDRTPVLTRFARSVDRADALALYDELARRLQDED